MLRQPLSRRQLLKTLGAGGAAVALGDLLLPGLARAADIDDPILLQLEFEGGWDQLLLFDPRDTRDTYPMITPAYELLAPHDPLVRQVLDSTGGSGVVTPAGSNIAFGPAAGRLVDCFADLCVIRGINMATLAHLEGQLQFATGLRSRGMTPVGSLLSGSFVAQVGQRTPLPNLGIHLSQSLGDPLPSFAVGVEINGPASLQELLTPQGDPLSSAAAHAVEQYFAAQQCGDAAPPRRSWVQRFKDSRTMARSLSPDLGARFAFTANPDPEVAELYEAFHIDGDNLAVELSGPRGRAAMAAQAIKTGLSQAVAVRLVGGLDHHFGWIGADHPTRLRAGCDALADLIGFLKRAHDTRGRPLWERTAIIAFSEFARAPVLSNGNGRDHHLTSSCVLTGGLVQGNTVIGASDDDAMSFLRVDPATGLPDPQGVEIRPADIHATLLAAMGLPAPHLQGAAPRLLRPAIRRA